MFLTKKEDVSDIQKLKSTLETDQKRLSNNQTSFNKNKAAANFGRKEASKFDTFLSKKDDVNKKTILEDIIKELA